MTEWERSLSSLPVYEPGPQRLKQVREACHAALRRQQTRPWIESAVVIGACAAYLSGVVSTALRLLRS